MTENENICPTKMQSFSHLQLKWHFISLNFKDYMKNVIIRDLTSGFFVSDLSIFISKISTENNRL